MHINTWLHPRFIPRGLPVLATLHHSIHDPALLPYKGWARATYHRHWIRRVECATMQRADAVMAVSQFAADSARHHVLDRSIQVIHNGVDTERFHPPAEGTPRHPFRLLYVGSWMARKGVDLLAPIMRELGDDFVLHYTGGKAAEKDKPGMPPNMIDLGRLSGDVVVSAMQDADALLFPSRSEGLPLGVLEAMACGLPVIGTRATAVAELVSDGETGLLCRGEDILEFVQAAQQLASDGKLCAKMRGASRQRVAAEFSSLSMIEKYIRQYELLAA
ncbi:MAG TPA: glycosyltransferase family 4 protein [Bellilinea sp.]|nr:glycosyltransferase family 4 protein [Bellilinea sp.]